MGRLTRDPEVRYAANDSGMAIVRYTLAVDRRRTGNDGQSADFINCVAFGKTGEFAEKYFRKGTKILISGRIQTGSYTNQEELRFRQRCKDKHKKYTQHPNKKTPPPSVDVF